MKKKILAILFAAILVLSVFTIGVFAEGEETDAVTEAATEGVETTEAATEDVETTEEATEEATEAATEKEEETPATTDPVTTIGADTTATKENWVEKHKSLFISLIVIAAVAVIVFILYLVSPKFREKFKKFWKDFNAEFKKLVWPTKKQLVRNSAVVLVTIVIAGALLALLDLGFHKGMYALKDLVEYIWPVQ